MKKKNIAIIFGGQSGEHEVSLMSATSVLKAIDKEKYNIIPMGITREGSWMLYRGPFDKIESGEWEELAVKLLQDNPKDNSFSIVPLGKDKLTGLPPVLSDKIDVIFPVLHGPFGEDGTIQGLFEMADIPYVGAGVLASSVGMDKIISKRIFELEGLPMGQYLVIMRNNFLKEKEETLKIVEESFEYPVFIKPANLGSSVGISKARDRNELMAGLMEAAKHDRKILVEEFIDCREVECAVLGNDDPKPSVLGEILPSHEFYDYESKYFDDGKSKLIIPAQLPEEVSREIRAMAVRAYKAIDCSGLARVDFFIEKNTNKVYINELNTMPGFTKYSMYPMLWQATGLPYKDLIDKLIELAEERYGDKKR